MGKNLVFQMHFQQTSKKQLFATKGVYLNTYYKAYLVYRNPI